MRFVSVDALKAIFSKLTLPFLTMWTWVIGSYKHALTTIAAILGMIFVVFFPLFGTPSEPTADDIAKAWHDSLGRLGISTLYPPEEDFHVGDVLAVIAGTDDTPLRGSSVRIGHIDLRDEIKASRDRPTFPDTNQAKPIEKDGYRSQNNSEITQDPDNRISLTLVAFPGITFNHTAKSTGSIAGKLGIFGASRDEEIIDEIRIPVSETYGVPTLQAFARLHAWCNAPETTGICSEKFARRLLAFVVGDEVLTKQNGKYVYEIRLRVITRVFLMREIQHRRISKGRRGIEASTKSNSSRLEGENSTGMGSAAAKTDRSDSTEIGLQRMFQRPLVFGYRAITLGPIGNGIEEAKP
jgi:hypothetical protein